MKSVKKTILWSLLPTIVIVGLLCLGGMVGYGLAASRMRADFRAVAHVETLGSLVRQSDRENFAQAYSDSNSAAKEMDEFSYSVPNVMSPFVGCGPEPGQHHNAFINSLQFRSDKEVAIPKPSATYRIFITGGSTAFGSGAPSQDRTIGGYLNAILESELTPITKNKYEVFTMANPSWVTTHERIMIENRLVDLQPDLVISFSGNNDVHTGMNGGNVMWFRTVQEEFNWRVLNWAYEIFRLRKMADVVTSASGSIAPSLVSDRLEQNVKIRAFTLGLKNIPYVFCLQPTLAVTRKPLTDAEQVILRNLKPFNSPKPGSNYFSECYARIDSRLTNLKITNFTYLNLSSAFDASGDLGRIFLDSYHYGDKGNAVVARALFTKLQKVLTDSRLQATQPSASVGRN